MDNADTAAEYAAATQDAAAYAASVEECSAPVARHHARKMGLSPGLLFKLGLWAAALVAKLRALAGGQPISEVLRFNAFGKPLKLTATLEVEAPPQMPRA